MLIYYSSTGGALNAADLPGPDEAPALAAAAAAGHFLEGTKGVPRSGGRK